MPKQVQPNRKSNGLKAPTLIVGTFVLFAAVFAYVKFNPNANRVPANELRRDRQPVAGRTAEPTKETTPKPDGKVNVSNPYYEGDDLRFSHSTETVPAGKSSYITAVNAFLKKSKVVDDNSMAISAKLDGTVLVLDFQKGFDRTYGAEDEQTLVKGLLDTAKQFKGVSAIRILVEGSRIETLGNVDLTEDLPVE